MHFQEDGVGSSNVLMECFGSMGGSQRDLEVSRHINVKEAVALKNSLALFCASNLDKIKGKTVIVKVDNQVLSYIYENGGSTQQQEITRVCKRLFWLQLQAQFRLKLQWIPLGENKADGITIEGRCG